MPAFSITNDSFSPMLVKELRQGIKSRAFMFAFLLMQALMVFCVLMFVTAFESSHNSTEFDSLFWICLGATLVFIMPIRALSALQQEIKGNTIELIFLTRLSAWRILAGKWLALFSQAFLLTSGTLPYLLLRYFLGSINIADDVIALFWLLVASAVLIALGVCFSSFVAQWIRVLIYIFAVFVFPYFSLFAIFGLARGGTFHVFPHPALFRLFVTVCAALGVMLCLVWGASRIAPLAENHARWKRLLTFALIGMLPALAWASGGKEIVFAGLFVLIPMCVEALGEQPRMIPSVYAPFARRGVPGRLAGLLFYPGWQSAVFFTLLACVVFTGIFIAFGPALDDHTKGLLASLPGALLFPPAMLLLFKPRMKNLLAGCIAIQIACIIFALVGLSLHAAFSSLTLLPLCILPPSAFILHLVQTADDATWIPITAAISVFSLLILFIRMRPVMSKIRDLERIALNGNISDASAPN